MRVSEYWERTRARGKARYLSFIPSVSASPPFLLIRTWGAQRSTAGCTSADSLRKEKNEKAHLLDDVRERNHADLSAQNEISIQETGKKREKSGTNGLPDSEPDARGDTAVEALDAALLVDVRERVEHGQLRRSVDGGVLRHRLHLFPPKTT